MKRIKKRLVFVCLSLKVVRLPLKIVCLFLKIVCLFLKFVRLFLKALTRIHTETFNGRNFIQRINLVNYTQFFSFQELWEAFPNLKIFMLTCLELHPNPNPKTIQQANPTNQSHSFIHPTTEFMNSFTCRIRKSIQNPIRGFHTSQQATKTRQIRQSQQAIKTSPLMPSRIVPPQNIPRITCSFIIPPHPPSPEYFSNQYIRTIITSSLYLSLKVKLFPNFLINPSSSKKLSNCTNSIFKLDNNSSCSFIGNDFKDWTFWEIDDKDDIWMIMKQFKDGNNYERWGIYWWGERFKVIV